jgi:uncharacterized protein (DUF1919 family)
MLSGGSGKILTIKFNDEVSIEEREKQWRDLRRKKRVPTKAKSLTALLRKSNG